MTARVAVLVSGSGTNLQALIDAQRTDPDFGGQIVAVASDREDAYGLERARGAGIDTFVVRMADHPDRQAWEKALVERLIEHAPDVIVLAGFMKLLSGQFLAQWPQRVVNTHPSLLPSFRGAHAVAEALDYGVKVTGCTVHLVDEQVDHGPIIAQRAVEVRDGDDETTLQDRIKSVEHELFPHCVKLLCNDRIRVEGRRVHVRD